MHKKILITFFAISLGVTVSPAIFAYDYGRDFDAWLDMNLEELLAVEVTSVSKKKQLLKESATAIFVITNEDIRRSGATSIPEVLRLAPGLQVARMQSNKWAISSRGFNAEFANKLLVLIDGRSVYTPTFSGVYWEDQDTILDDIDRIEVIRGPGASLWGANAVNGVINIITKTAHQTRGGLAQIVAGNEEKAIVQLRYGDYLSKDVAARVYGKFTDRDASFAPDFSQSANDDWQTYRGGFRLDSTTDTVKWRIQGDIYSNDLEQIAATYRRGSFDFTNELTPEDVPPLERNVREDIDTRGQNLLGHWEKQISPESLLSIQAYLDYTERQELRLGQEVDTYDLELQHLYSGFENHSLIWGLGYRRTEDQYLSSFGITVDRPASQSNELFSGFLQDEITFLENKLRLTLGTKLEHNDYTGLEIQPSAKMLWLPEPGLTVWGSVSRAVRTPSAIERRGSLTVTVLPLNPPVRLAYLADNSFESEDLLAWEMGLRLQPSESTSVDIALFFHQYENIATYETAEELTLDNPFGAPVVLPLTVSFKNELEVETYGAELVFDWRITSRWRWQATYSFIDIAAQNNRNSTDLRAATLVEGATPNHQLGLRSIHDISATLALDLWAYYVDDLGATTYLEADTDSIDSYISFNLSLNWQLFEDFEVSLVGQNLLENNHQEFNSNFNVRSEVERSIYAGIKVRF